MSDEKHEETLRLSSALIEKKAFSGATLLFELCEGTCELALKQKQLCIAA